MTSRAGKMNWIPVPAIPVSLTSRAMLSVKNEMIMAGVDAKTAKIM
jgi:hypothetical protein